jgi:hypothetical protein
MWEKKNKEEEKNLAFVGSIATFSSTLLIPFEHF